MDNKQKLADLTFLILVRIDIIDRLENILSVINIETKRNPESQTIGGAWTRQH